MTRMLEEAPNGLFRTHVRPFFPAILLSLATSVCAAPIDTRDVQVIDGDTIRVGHRQPNVRLVGFNAPEIRARKLFEAAKDRARNLAQKHLQRGMLRLGQGPKSYTQVALDLLDTKRWLTHGQMIGPDDAKEIGLEVEYLESTNKEWRQYWKVYCRQRLAVTDREKLFESHYVSLATES
jgi:hypothetical protein